MKRILLTLAVSLAFVATGAQAQLTIANWTFEVSQPTGTGSLNGPYSPEEGLQTATATALGSHASATTVWSNPAGNAPTSGESFSSTQWAIGDFYQFTISTAGLTDINVSWDQHSSNTGPRDFALLYSTDGTTFFTQQSYMVPNAFGTNPMFTDTNAAWDNQATLIFRLAMQTDVAANQTGTVATGGTDRVDNFLVTGIPEPATFVMLLGGFGILFGLQRVRRRS